MDKVEKCLSGSPRQFDMSGLRLILLIETDINCPRDTQTETCNFGRGSGIVEISRSENVGPVRSNVVCYRLVELGIFIFRRTNESVG